MNRPFKLTALVSTLSLWTLRFGVEAATYPKSAKSRTSLGHAGRGTLDQDIQDATQERNNLTDLEQKFYISKPDFSYSGLQFNLVYLVSDYIEESNLEVIHRRILHASRTLAFTYSHSHHLYLVYSTKYMTDISAQKVLLMK
jgi:hypothetical protein